MSIFNQDMILEKKTEAIITLLIYGMELLDNMKQLILLQGRLTAAPYLRDVLKEHILPFFLRNHFLFFMQDNAPPHLAIPANDFLR